MGTFCFFFVSPFLLTNLKKQNVPITITGHHGRMPRTARASKGGICYHVISRGNRRATVFHNRADYLSFTDLMKRACDRIPMRVVSYCLMPNHFHFVVWPYQDQDLSKWMQWLLTAHVRRHHRVNETDGRVWQGRFKAFPIQSDRHLLTVMRYVERNPLRANLVDTAGDWPWSSLGNRTSIDFLVEGPVTKPQQWRTLVDRPQSEDELKALRTCSARNAPYGDSQWTASTARLLGLEANLRPLGRPRKHP